MIHPGVLIRRFTELKVSSLISSTLSRSGSVQVHEPVESRRSGSPQGAGTSGGQPLRSGG